MLSYTDLDEPPEVLEHGLLDLPEPVCYVPSGLQSFPKPHLLCLGRDHGHDVVGVGDLLLLPLIHRLLLDAKLELLDRVEALPVIFYSQ